MTPQVLDTAETLAGTPRLPLRAKAQLIAEVVRTYWTARRLMRREDLPAALAQLRDAGHDGPEPDLRRALISGARLSRAVTGTLRTLPVDSRCLMQSLVLSALLARRGIPGRLVIGVQPGEAFGAHAWVEVHGRALLEPGGERFARLVDL